MQLINFAIFLLVMWKWVLPRITSMLEQRKQGIAESLAAAETAKAEAAAAETKREEQLARARQEVASMLEAAKAEATATAQQITEAAKAEAVELQARGQQQLAADRAKMQTELRAELAGLTVEATRRVLADSLTEHDRTRITEQAAKQLASQRSGDER